mgnify:FL=1
MQTLILNHYPPVIKQIKEMQQIAKAEDIEFSKLNVSINKVIRNMFVFTADETGVMRFEKLLGIKPKAAQSLDDRKIYILSMMNRRKMSLSELMAMLSNYSEGITILNDIANMEMIVEINTDAGSLDMLNKIIDEILPLNIYFMFAMQRETVIKYRIEDLIFMAFEPAAADTEYCNFDNNITERKETGYIQNVGGFSFVHEENPISGQAVCGVECCLGLQAPFELQEGAIAVETAAESIETPVMPCSDDLTVIGEYAPFETRESVISIETAGNGTTTPVIACGDNTAAIGTDPPFEMQESAAALQMNTEAATNDLMMCGTDYAREEG